MSIADQLRQSQSGVKGFVDSTHRMCPPEETLRRYGPLMSRLGITRLANITGLDRIGIPVVIAVRPMSRGLATAQGKGLDLPAAKASALMEAIETWHAERMESSVRFVSQAELSASEMTIDIAGLQCRAGRVAAATKVFAWMCAEELHTGRPIWVPLDAVACDFSSDVVRHSTFLTTTNGLASGNHSLEATLHALCELVERDAVTLHLAASPGQRDARRLALDSIREPRCRILMASLDAAEMDLAVWDCTSDLGIPVISALIIEKHDNAWQWRGPHRGHGCHPNPVIAFIRAVCEAVQSRMTYISGSRDDLFPEHYEQLRAQSHEALHRRHFSCAPTRLWSAMRDLSTLSHGEDLRGLLDRLRTAGLTQVAVADLSRSDIGVPVVKVLVPGLENNVHANPHYRPGPRLRQALRQEAA